MVSILLLAVGPSLGHYCCPRDADLPWQEQYASYAVTLPASVAEGVPSALVHIILTCLNVSQGVEQPKVQAEAEDDTGETGAEDDDCAAEFKPIVQLSEVETVSGEEAETALCDL